MERLVECLSTDDPDFVETVLDKDCNLNLSVERSLIQLDQFCENICSEGVIGEKTSDPSDTKKVSNGAKIRNRYNQVPHLTRDTNGKVTNSQ